MHHTGLYIGLMSGTSIDSIDAAMVEFSPAPHILATHTEPLSDAIKSQILALCEAGPDEIERAGRLDRTLGYLFAQAANTLLEKASLAPSRVTAIGSHGQTIRHRPPDTGMPAQQAFTLQIADPNTICELTGIATVADFRRRDIAAGGQGAPLVPAFHRAVFHDPAHHRAIINVGGMANITVLARDGRVAGYDIGPGNALMDGWILRHRGVRYDDKGTWSASGKVVQPLLDALLNHPFFAEPPPKSTGREAFNMPWLDQCIGDLGGEIAAEDVQATLLELTASAIATCVNSTEPTLEDVYICGGGAYNDQLMSRLKTLIHPRDLASTAQLGIEPGWVEAAAFAWLARQTLAKQAGNLPTATGAQSNRILGGIYLP